jgi:hypothetical protein
MRSLMICAPYPVLFGWLNRGECDGWASSAYGGEERAYTWFWLGNLRERDLLGHPGVDERIISKSTGNEM